MSRIRKCYNANCECNLNGGYCEADEVIIGSGGVCETFCPRIEDVSAEEEDDHA